MSREGEARKVLAGLAGPADWCIAKALALLVVETAALNDAIREHSPFTVKHEVVEVASNES